MKRLVILLVSTWAVPALAITIHVPADYATIQAAIQASANGDTVLVAPGTYAESVIFGGKAILLLASAGPDSTTIVAATTGAVVQFANGEDSSSVIRGFAIDGSGNTRGIWVNFASPIIEECEFFNCSSDDDGSAIACMTDSRAKIRNNVMHDNQTHTLGKGGVIYVLLSDPEITGNTIYANTAWGPVIQLMAGPSKVWNNLIYANGTPSQPGAGIWANGDGHEIVNNTVAGNPKGIYCNTGSGTILNNIVVSNLGEGIRNSGGYTIDFNDAWNNGSENTPGVNGFSLDPAFMDAPNFDYTLQAGSPCIDAGDPGLPLDPDGTRADVGAFYFVHPPGDVSGDGKVGASDVVYLVNYVLKAGPPPAVLNFGDVNATCTITSADIVYLVNYVFKAGPAPVMGCVP